MNPSNRVYEIILKPNYLECFRIMKWGGGGDFVQGDFVWSDIGTGVFCPGRYWNEGFCPGEFCKGDIERGDVVRGGSWSGDIVWGDIESCFLSEGGGGFGWGYFVQGHNIMT